MKVHHSVIMRPFFPNCSQVEQYPEQCGLYRYVHVFVYIDSGNSQSVYIFKVIDALAVYCYLNSIVCKQPMSSVNRMTFLVGLQNEPWLVLKDVSILFYISYTTIAYRSVIVHKMYQNLFLLIIHSAVHVLTIYSGYP